MSNYITLQHLEILQITDKDNQCCFGASQLWYPDRWKRSAGCGPTTCANLYWYLLQTVSLEKDLVSFKVSTDREFIELMEAVWMTVTPGKLGVNTTDIFGQGAINYALSQGVKLTYESLKIPVNPFQRPDQKEVISFITNSLANNSPIAFLNLSNGRLANLESWHWVTIVGFSPKSMFATIYDNGKQVEIDLGLWLRTTIFGGGLLTLKVI